MKALCPVCNIEGFLQVRGSNAMIQHYVGFKDGKRIYQYHKVDAQALQVNASKPLQVKTVDLSCETAKGVRRVGFEPTNPCGIGASVLRLWPCWATSACMLPV